MIDMFDGFDEIEPITAVSKPKVQPNLVEPTSPNFFQGFEEINSENEPVLRNLKVVRDRDPVAEAKAFKDSVETGAPVTMTRENTKLNNTAQVKAVENATTTVKRLIAKDTNNAAIFGDSEEINNLSTIDRILSEEISLTGLGRSAITGVAEGFLEVPKAAGELFELVSGFENEHPLGLTSLQDAQEQAAIDKRIESQMFTLGSISRDAQKWLSGKYGGRTKLESLIEQSGHSIGLMLAALLTGGEAAVLPGISIVSGIGKAAEARRDGATMLQSVAAGGASAITEYLTEIIPLKILRAPAMTFFSRLGAGLVADIPGELLATATEMRLIDEGILGGEAKSVEEYKQALIDTAIVAGFTTLGVTTPTHAMGKAIESSEAIAKKSAASNDKLARVSQAVEATNTSKISPEKLQEAIKDMDGDEDIYIADTLFQTDAEQAEAIMKKVGVDVQQAKASASLGQDIAVKQAKIFSLLTPEERTFVLSHVKSDVYDLTPEQLQTGLSEDERFLLQDALDEITTEDLEFSAEIDRLKSEMQAAGVNADVADANTALVEKFVNGLALQGQDRTAVLGKLGLKRTPFVGRDIQKGTNLAQEALPEKTVKQKQGFFKQAFGAVKDLVTGKVSVDSQIPLPEGATTEAQLKNMEDNYRTFFQSAFHGTPHRFDKFSLEHLGKGEGNQAFGWGLYFAEKKGIAEHYRKVLTERVHKGGDTFFKGANTRELKNLRLRVRLNDIAFQMVTFPGRGFDAIKEARINELNELIVEEEALLKEDESRPDKWIIQLNEAKGVIESSTRADFKREGGMPKGSVLKVELPQDDEILNWEKPLSEQSETVQKAVQDAGAEEAPTPEFLNHIEEEFPSFADKEFNDLTEAQKTTAAESYRNATGWNPYGVGGETLGREIYKLMSRNLGSEKAASEWLSEHGIKGHKFWDGDSRNKSGDKTFNFVIYDDTAIDIVETFFQAQKGKDPKAMIGFTEDTKGRQRAIISLFEKSDISSIPHELGHFFLQEMDQVSRTEGITDQFKADMGSLRTWLEMDGDATEFTVEQQEQFARGFELWLREGKAPNKEMYTVFARFKRWLEEVYKSAKELNVKLTPEIRGVFNRMLGAGKDTDTAAAVNNMIAPTRSRMDELGIQSDEQSRIKLLVAGSVEKATNDLFIDRNRAVRKETPRFKEESLAEILADDVRGVYETIEFLKKAESSRLNRQEFIELYGVDAIKDLPAQNILIKDGIALDDAAEIYDFNSGEDMMQAFMETAPLQEAIDFRVALKVEALENTFTPENYLAKSKGYSEYIEAMAGHLEQAEERILKAEAKGVSRKKITTEQLKAAAFDRMSELSVSDAQRTDRFLAAMKSAGIAMAKAERAKDYGKAIRENQKMFINKEMAAQSTRNRKEVTAFVNRSKKYRKLGSPKSVSYQYREGIRRIIEKFQILPRVAPQGNVNLDKLFRGDGETVVFIPSDFMVDGKTRDYRKMTMLELKEIDNAMGFFSAQGKAEQSGLLSNGQTLLQEVGRGSMAEMDTQNKQRVFDQLNPWRKLSDPVRKKLAEITNISFITNALGGYQTLKGQTSVLEQNVTEVLKDMTDDQSRRYRKEIEATKPFTDHLINAQRKMISKHGRKLYTKDHGVPVPALMQRNGAQLNYFKPEQIIAMAFNRGNDSNTNALLAGFQGLTLGQVDTLLNKYLTTEDINSVQGIIDGMEGMFQDADNVHLRMKGYRMERVQPRAWTFKGKEYKGGYYPLAIDRQLASTNTDVFKSLEEAENWFEGSESQYSVPFASSGFANTRKEGHALPIDLRLHLVNKHFDTVVRYITMAERTKDINRILTYTEKVDGGTVSFKKSAVRIMGEDMYDQLIPAVKHTVNPRLSGVDIPGQKFVGWLRSIATAKNLALKVSVGLKQPFSFFGGVHDMGRDGGSGFKAFLKGAAHVMASPSVAFSTMREKSAYMNDRINSFDRDLLRPQFKRMTPAAKELAFGDRHITWSDVTNAAFITVSAPDIATVTPIWWGSYLDKLNELGTNEQEAIRYADNIIRHSQPTSAPIDRSAWFRKNGFWSLFNLHQTFTVGTYGQRQRTWYRAWRAGRVSNAEYLKFNMMDAIVPMILMQTMVSWMRSGELGEGEDWEAIVAKAAQSWVLMGIPMADSLANALILGKRRDLFAIPGAGQIDRWLQTGNLIVGGDLTEDEHERALMGVTDMVADISRVPFTRVYRQVTQGDTVKEKMFGKSRGGKK